MSWAAFARAEPDLAAAGLRLLHLDEGLPLAFIATVSRAGAPHLSPVCPILRAGEIHLSIGEHTQKVRDLRHGGAYVLHAFLGDRSEEFQIAGVAELVTDEAERGRAHAAIPLPEYDVADPVFRDAASIGHSPAVPVGMPPSGIGSAAVRRPRQRTTGRVRAGAAGSHPLLA